MILSETHSICMDALKNNDTFFLKKHQRYPSPGFDPGSLESKSSVLTVRPQGIIELVMFGDVNMRLNLRHSTRTLIFIESFLKKIRDLHSD